jgi:hypothetical protein
MIQLASHFDVAGRSPEQVFDFMADFRNEKRWDEFNIDPQKVTDGPIGVGTRFTARNVKMGPVEVEILEYQRPARLVLGITAKMGYMRFFAELQPHAGGTRVATRNEMQLAGLFRLMSPFVGAMMRKQQPPHQAKLKRFLEERL